MSLHEHCKEFGLPGWATSYSAEEIAACRPFVKRILEEPIEARINREVSTKTLSLRNQVLIQHKEIQALRQERMLLAKELDQTRRELEQKAFIVISPDQPGECSDESDLAESAHKKPRLTTFTAHPKQHLKCPRCQRVDLMGLVEWKMPSCGHVQCNDCVKLSRASKQCQICHAPAKVWKKVVLPILQ